MSHYLITGGAGFIGSHLVAQCLQQKHQVTVVDNLSTGKRDNLEPWISNGDVNFIEADINNHDGIHSAFSNADHVCHLAARISVPESFEIAADYYATNTIGTSRVVDLATQHQCNSIVLASSAAVYGDNPTLPKTEDMLPEPQSPYAISKLDGEYILKIANQQHGIRSCSMRFFNVFGPRQDPNSAYSAAVPIFIDRAVQGKDIIIYGDGKQTRDFIFAEDVAKACMSAGLNGDGVINAACGKTITILELAKQIIDITGSSSQIEHQPPRQGDIKHSCANNNRLLEQLKIQPQADLRSGLEATVEYFQALQG